jgi:hypothetical protein
MNKTSRKRWEEDFRKSGLREADFSSISGRPLQPVYTPEDLPGFDADASLGFPGQYPYTRGIHPSMYRGKLWTMRQFSGMGTPEQTNERYKFLLARGQTGLSVAFDNPTLYGRDSDHPLALGEVGKTGVAVDSLADMERLFNGIPLDEVSTSMTINAPAAWIFAMFMANAEVRTPVTDSALAEMLHQLDRIRNEVPADSEITAAKNYLVGNFPLTIQTPEQIANAVAAARLRGLPDDYVPRFRDRLAAVTGTQLGAADKQFLTTDRMVIVVVGDGTKILDGLKRLGSVRIVDVEGKPMAEADLAAAPTPITWAPDRLAPSSYTYRAMVQGNPMGQAAAAQERATEGDRQVLRLTSSMSLGGMISVNDTATVDAVTLAPIHLREGGSQGGQAMSVSLDYQGTHLTGHVHVPTREGVRDAAVDTTLAQGTMLDLSSYSTLLTALPLASGARWTVNAYDGSEGVVRTLTASVTGEDSVTVPAGAFACWKVELTGGQIPITYYITKAAPYLIAKYALVGAPVVFELTAKTP